jgi:Family of unknown function (DUF6807)
MLELRAKSSALEVRLSSTLLGRYHHTDPFKPYLHPLCTAGGTCLSLAHPHDHPHHKGLMYALRTESMNFWEESPTASTRRIGRQRHLGFDNIRNSGESVGWTQRLAWEPVEGGDAIIHETRTVNCCIDWAAPAPIAQWEWRAQLKINTHCRLIQSEWSAPHHAGKGKVNYHGLGLRLRRDFGCTGNDALLCDGVRTKWTEAMGRSPAEAVFEGALDGMRQPTRAWVGIHQDKGYALFATNSCFAFFSFGPSNASEIALVSGETINEAFIVRLADGPYPLEISTGF